MVNWCATIALLVLAFCGALSVYWNVSLARELFVGATYYIIFAAFFIPIGLAIAWRFRTLSKIYQQYCRHIFFVFGASSAVLLVTFAVVEPGYRVLSDETNLLAVAQSMASERTVYNTTMSKFYYDQFHAINNELPTRPVLYPFLVSLTHNFSGYRYANGFYTNAILAVVFAVFMWIFVGLRIGWWSGCALVFVVFANPLFSVCVTSAGFEITNLFFVFVFASLCSLFATNRRIDTFILSWYVGILCCHVRYENIGFLVIALVCLFANKGLLRLGLTRLALHFAIGIILLLPRFWQAFFSQGMYENGQKELLDPTRIPQRAWALLQGIFDPYLHYPYNFLLTLGLLVGVIALAFAWFRYRWRPSFFAVLLTLFGLFSFCVVGSHFLADPLHPAVFRLFLLPLCLFQAAICYEVFAAYGSAKYSKFYCGYAVFAWLVYLPVASNLDMTKSLTLIRSTKEVYAFLDREPDSRILVVVDRPGQYTVRKIGAVNFEYAAQHADDLLNDLDRKLYRQIYAVTEVNYQSQQESPIIPAKFAKSSVHEFQNDGSTKVIVYALSRKAP